MQVISRSPTPQHLVVSMKTSLSLGHKPFRHSTMRSGSSSSSSRFKIRPKQVNESTCDFDRCCLQSGDNTGTHLHVSRKAICRPKQQLHVSTSMESPMSFVSRLWMFLTPSVTRFWCETPSSVSILIARDPDGNITHLRFLRLSSLDSVNKYAFDFVTRQKYKPTVLN